MTTPWPHAAARPEPVGRYLRALLVSALLGFGLRLRIFYHYVHARYAPNVWLDWTRNGLMALFFALFLLFLWVYAKRVVSWRWRRQPLGHRQLRPLMVLASGLTMVNLLSENLAIYRLNLESYSLLLESLTLYITVTLVFLVWYWYIDHPPRQLSVPSPSGEADSLGMPYGIVFPEELMERDLNATEVWKPQFIDYFYFTILCSNCFGPPEGHSLVGAPMKKLHIFHSMSMISVFIVILARAINTLS